jgi:allantoin racemase
MERQAMATLGFLGTVVNPLRRSVRPELHASLPAGTILRAYPSRVGVFPDTPVERAMQAIGHLEAGLSAERDGCDAAVIDSVGDYGLPALAAALTIPVVGAGHAGMAASAAGGRRFAIVTVWPTSMNFITEDLLRDYGYAASCLSILNIGEKGDLAAIAGPDGYLERVHRAEGSILDRVVAACETALAEGADAIMLGCTCMSPMASAVAARVGGPVINPLAEAAAGAARLAGVRSAAKLKPGRAEQVRQMVDAIAGQVAEECPVCIVAAA